MSYYGHPFNPAEKWGQSCLDCGEGALHYNHRHDYVTSTLGTVCSVCAEPSWHSIHTPATIDKPTPEMLEAEKVAAETESEPMFTQQALDEASEPPDADHAFVQPGSFYISDPKCATCGVPQSKHGAYNPSSEQYQADLDAKHEAEAKELAEAIWTKEDAEAVEKALASNTTPVAQGPHQYVHPGTAQPGGTPPCLACGQALFADIHTFPSSVSTGAGSDPSATPAQAITITTPDPTWAEASAKYKEATGYESNKPHPYTTSASSPDKCLVCGNQHGYHLHQQWLALQASTPPGDPSDGHGFVPGTVNQYICAKCNQTKAAHTGQSSTPTIPSTPPGGTAGVAGYTKSDPTDHGYSYLPPDSGHCLLCGLTLSEHTGPLGPTLLKVSPGIGGATAATEALVQQSDSWSTPHEYDPAHNGACKVCGISSAQGNPNHTNIPPEKHGFQTDYAKGSPYLICSVCGKGKYDFTVHDGNQEEAEWAALSSEGKGKTIFAQEAKLAQQGVATGWDKTEAHPYVDDGNLACAICGFHATWWGHEQYAIETQGAGAGPGGANIGQHNWLPSDDDAYSMADCSVCGEEKNNPVHYKTFPTKDTPMLNPAPPGSTPPGGMDPPTGEAAEPHMYQGADGSLCSVCSQPKTDDIHGVLPAGQSYATQAQVDAAQTIAAKTDKTKPHLYLPSTIHAKAKCAACGLAPAALIHYPYVYEQEQKRLAEARANDHWYVTDMAGTGVCKECALPWNASVHIRPEEEVPTGEWIDPDSGILGPNLDPSQTTLGTKWASSAHPYDDGLGTLWRCAKCGKNYQALVHVDAVTKDYEKLHKHAFEPGQRDLGAFAVGGHCARCGLPVADIVHYTRDHPGSGLYPIEEDTSSRYGTMPFTTQQKSYFLGAQNPSETAYQFTQMLRRQDSYAVTAVIAGFEGAQGWLEEELAYKRRIANLGTAVAGGDYELAQQAYLAGEISDADLQRFLQSGSYFKKYGTTYGTSAAWEFQQGRLEEIDAALKSQMAMLADQLAGKVADASWKAESLGKEYATEAVRATTGIKLPREISDAEMNMQIRAGFGAVHNRLGYKTTAGQIALAQIQGLWLDADVLTEGQVGTGSKESLSPLAKHFGNVGAMGYKAMRGELDKAVLLGLHPREIAQNVSAALGSTLTRGMTIARTETARAYRAGMQSAWRESPHMVPEWEWLSARDDTTCIVCWGMDGEKFSMKLEMATHPNCRCTMLPVLPGMDELTRKLGGDWLADGLSDEATRFDIAAGAESVAAAIVQEMVLTIGTSGQPYNSKWFDRMAMRSMDADAGFKQMTRERQKAILGPTRFDHYRRNIHSIKLNEFVNWPTEDTGWGSVPKPKTLADMGLRRLDWKPPEAASLGRFRAGERPFDPNINPKAWDVGGRYYSDESSQPSQKAMANAASGVGRADMKDRISTDLARRLDNDAANATLVEMEMVERHLNALQLPKDNSSGRYPYTMPKDWADMDADERKAALDGPDGNNIRRTLVNQMIENWASSSTGNPFAAAMQLAADQEFDLHDDAYRAHLDEYAYRSRRGDANEILYSQEDYIRLMLRAQYEATQRWLHDPAVFPDGSDYIQLGRGFNRDVQGVIDYGLEGIDVNDTDIRNIQLQPLSSWASSLQVAHGFADHNSGPDSTEFVATSLIPKAWILGTSVTGYGCLSESEYVVMGAHEVEAQVYVSASPAQAQNDPNSHDFEDYSSGFASSPALSECDICGYHAEDHADWVSYTSGKIVSHFFSGEWMGFAPNEKWLCKHCGQKQGDHYA